MISSHLMLMMNEYHNFPVSCQLMPLPTNILIRAIEEVITTVSTFNYTPYFTIFLVSKPLFLELFAKHD
jgi:hypothetical protein